MTEPIHIISLGAGVQSSAMALMAAKGLITPMPQCAIFADTGDEPSEVYAWLEKLTELLPFPVHIVKPETTLSEGIVNRWGHSQIPAFYMNEKGEASIGKRQCTKHFKITPIRRAIRELFPNQDVNLWCGISIDEATRAKDSGVQWLTHKFPMLEHRMNRHECSQYVVKLTGEVPPKSACVYCPYRRADQWRISQKSEEQMRIIRKVEAILIPRGEYLHTKMKPIDEIDFSTMEELGQLNLFENECEGMCNT